MYLVFQMKHLGVSLRGVLGQIPKNIFSDRGLQTLGEKKKSIFKRGCSAIDWSNENRAKVYSLPKRAGVTTPINPLRFAQGESFLLLFAPPH